MRRSIVSTLFTALIFLSACKSSTEPVSSDIQGLVLDSSARPIAGATIVLEYRTRTTTLAAKIPATVIRWSQMEAGHATLWMASYCGNDSLRTLFDEEVQAGEHEIIWDGLDDAGRLLPEGVYRVHLILDGAGDVMELARLGLDYGNLSSSAPLRPLAVTDAQGRFGLNQACLPFGFTMPQTDEAGNVLGLVTITRQVRVWAFDSPSNLLGTSDWIAVDAETGAFVTLSPPD